MRTLFQLPRPLAACLCCCFALFLSCEEVDPTDDGNPDNPGNPSTGGADFLRLLDKQKVDGTLSIVPKGSMTIDVKDTIYVVKDNPYMARVSVKHDSTDKVDCFNIWSESLETAYYYNIPIAAESNDSISVFYISMDPVGVSFSYSEKIRIQPCGTGGAFDEFERVITVEDPATEEPVCEIWTETEDAETWKWLFTQAIYPSGEFFKITAPNFEQAFTSSAGYRYGKCCWEDDDFGAMEVYPNDTTPKGNCEQGNPYYHSVQVADVYTLRAYEYIFIFSSGNFIHYTATIRYDFEPWNSRICEGYAHYARVAEAWTKTGTHNYTPGASEITFTTLVSNPAFGPIPPRGKVVRTCHLLLIEITQDITYKWVYQRFPGITPDNVPDSDDNLDTWFP